MKKKNIDIILIDIINKEYDLYDTVSFNELNKMIEVLFKNKKGIEDILESIKYKLSNEKVFIRKKENSFEILIYLGNKYDIFNVKYENDDLNVENALYESPHYNNIVQLIGDELIQCYEVLFDIKNNLDKFTINNDDYNIVYDNVTFKINFNDLGNTSLEKTLFNDEVKINSTSYNATKFIKDNLDMVLENLRISKKICPPVLVDYFDKEKIIKKK